MYPVTKIIIGFAIIYLFLPVSGFGTERLVGDIASGIFPPLDSIQAKSPVKFPIGPCYAVAFDRERKIVFCGAGEQIQMFDVTQPDKPVLRPESIRAADGVYDLFYDAQILYAACGAAGLDIWDVRDLSNPKHLATGSVPGWSYALKVTGTFAFLAAGRSGIQIMDVSDPQSPVRVGGYAASGLAVDIDINGYYAFVADYDAGLRVFNVVQPDNPYEIGVFTSPRSVLAIHAGAHYVYLADVGGLHIVSVKNLLNPMEASYYKTPDAVRDIAIVYPYAYVTDYSAGIRIINISRPDNPSEAGYYDTPGLAFRLLVDEGYAFVADGNGFCTQNVSHPANRTTLILFPILFVLMWFPIMKLLF